MSIIKTHNITLHGSTGEHDITLRPLCDEHLPLLYKWNADPEVLYWCEGEDVQENDADTVHIIYGNVSQAAFCFLVEVDGYPIGGCWLQKMNMKSILERYPSNADVRRIDMMIGEKDYWNRGIGATFIGMLVEFAFSVENVDVLHVFSFDYNVRSQRVFEKNGFRLFMRERSESPKAKEDVHFQLLREDYENKGS
ncbi:MAG: GNAT family N-acetyltransferase [Oscillospiraceae bacterium]|nr:GNAT family N-acetyltransferase [Oscillospiraceae bacterium]